jgi:hypothetical protein
MGMSLMGNTSYSQNDKSMAKTCSGALKPGDPNPQNFEVINAQQIGKNLLVEIRYHDCKNYEGKKIILYLNTTLRELLSQDFIDPHFTDGDSVLSPFARLEPTDQGWEAGFMLAQQLAEGRNNKTVVASQNKDTWDEPESELTRAMNRSLERNQQNTKFPVALARMQTKALRENR